MSVLSDRASAEKPKSDSPTNVFPRPHPQIAPERGWAPRPDLDIAVGDSDVARSVREPAPHFEFSRIAVFSSEQRQPPDALETAFSAGRNLGMRFGEVPSARAVPPSSAPLPLPLQAKLEVGSVADPLEKEADAAADRVMRTSAAASPAGVRTSTATVGSAAAPHIVYDVLRSPGEALEAGVRAFMEPRFGHDFRQVRVHADARAAESAEALKARAYTVGPHVVFGAASYAPGTTVGRRLIAHELSHVVQQRHGPALRIQRQPVEDWNFTRGDYAKVTASKTKLTVASDSTWFPAKLQQNLLNTLDFVFGSTVSPPATEGVNAMDFFHGHLVIKKDPATAAQTTTAAAQGARSAPT